jgi:uncharacterized protein (DUF2141 family)
MKTLVLKLVLLLAVSFTYAQESGKSITVTIDNVTSDEGKVLLALHTKDTFMKAGGVAEAESTIKDGKVTVSFDNVAPGEYAIIALHDANNNGKMDFAENGMPKEAYGSSNNPMSYGPPQYEDSKFIVSDKNLELNIRF